MSSTLRRAIVAAFITTVLAPAFSYALPPSTPPTWTYPTRGGAAQFGSVYDGELYVSSYDGWVRQLNLHTGALVREWNVSASGTYSAPVRAKDGELYVFAKNKSLYRLNKTPTPTTTKLCDYSGDSGIARVESLAYDPATDLFFLGTAPNVRAVDSSGALQWSLPHGNWNWGQPMSNDGYLYTFDVIDTVESVHKYAIAGGSPVLQWKVPFPARTVNMSKGVDGDGDTLVFAVNWEFEAGPGGTGKIAAIYDSGPLVGTKKWEHNLTHTIKHASLWEGHNTLVIPAMNGTVEYRSASTGDFLGSTTLSGGATPDGLSQSPWSQVTISGDYAIVSTMDKSQTSTPDPNYLFVIDLKTGEEMWRSEPLAGGYASCMIPILSEGMAIVGTYESGAAWSAFDLGEGDAVEFSRFGNAYNTGNIPGGLTNLTVPEPASAIFLAVGGVMVAWRKRRR